jgi:hypothetical protein
MTNKEILFLGVMIVAAVMANSDVASATTQEEEPINPPTNNLEVAISSPPDGEELPIDEVLTISGTSDYGDASDCKVTVKLNEVAPYQDTMPQGSAGVEDYSQWSYSLTPDYAMLNEGPNRITSKLSCEDSGLNKWNSVNVTGISNGGSASEVDDDDDEDED